MVQVSLKKLIVKPGVLNVLHGIINDLGLSLWIEDVEGQPLLGTSSPELHCRFPVSSTEVVIGWVKGDEKATVIASLLSYLAQQEAEKKGLANELLEKYQELDLFYDISTQITAGLDLKQIAQLVIQKVGELIESTHCAILLLNRATDQLDLVLGVGEIVHSPQGLRADTGIIGSVIQIGNAEIVNDVTADPRSIQHPLQVSSLLCAPLKTRDHVIGAIAVGSKTPTTYSAENLKLLDMVASQTAGAIEKALLYEQSCNAATAAQAQAQKLQRALEELQHAQAQLIQSEKMSSLGQLIAGVAHEINNPVNFIYGNLTYATDYIRDLLQILQHYQQVLPHATPEIQLEIDALDLDFLVEDLPKLMNSMKMGADRILEIVRSLKNFSRHDEVEMRAVDIHEGIDSTLMILHNRFKPRTGHPGVRLTKVYGELPPVECYPGQLNQVFMNILANALDALEERDEGRSRAEIEAHPSQIEIYTEAIDSDWITIRIADNGSGIPALVRQQIFHPFFTTKPVGKGTGLGLAISHQIVVDRHGGILKCQSQPEQGTEFWIQIPVHLKVVSSRINADRLMLGPTQNPTASEPAATFNPDPGLPTAFSQVNGTSTEPSTAILRSIDLMTRHAELVKRLAYQNPVVGQTLPQHLYQRFQSNPILLKLYLALLL